MSRLGHVCCRGVLGVFAAMAVSRVAASSPAEVKEAAVIVLQGPGDPAVPEPVLVAVERTVDATNRLSVVRPDAIAQRLRENFQEAAALEPEIAEALERESGELLRAVAFGRDKETVALGTALLRRGTLMLAAINHSERGSRAFGNACLFVVRAFVHSSENSAARAQARECLRLIPDLVPSADEHPPDVRILLAAARSEALGKLVVIPAAPAEERCRVIIQGRNVGKLPLEIELVPGAYSLQTDCGEAGLLRRVTTHVGKTERVTVTPRLERALRLARPSVLRSKTRAGALRAEDLRQFADWLAVSEIWTIDRVGATLRVRRWLRTSRGLAVHAEIPTPIDPAVTLAARIEAAVAPFACRVAGCTESKPWLRGQAARTTGTIVSGVGVAAMLSSWAAWLRHAELARAIERGTEQPGYDSAKLDDLRGDRNSFRTIALVSTTAGGALFAAGMPFAIPERPGVPWWAWSVGAVGTATAVVGARLWVDDGERERAACPAGFVEPCWRARSTLPLAPMLVTQGVSLLSLPLTYAVRAWTSTDVGAVDLNAAFGGFSITWTRSSDALDAWPHASPRSRNTFAE